MVFRGCPVRRAVSRSTGPEDMVEKAPEGRNPRRASARRRSTGRGASSGSAGEGRVNGLSEGARLRSGRSGRGVGESGDVCGRRVRRAGQLARWSGGLGERGKLRPVLAVAIVGLVPPPRLLVERATESLTTSMRRRAGTRSRSNPQGSNGRRRGGTALREGKALKGESQGRLRHETRPHSYGDERRLERLGATRVSEAAGPKPPRG